MPSGKNPKSRIPAQSHEPFYKGNDAFWGTVGAGTGILAGVVAATAAIHWLVLASWIFLTGAFWFALVHARRRDRALWTGTVALLLAILLYNFDAKYVPDAPADQHTNLDILSPAAVTGDPYFPFRVGQKPNVAIQFINRGDHEANEAYLMLGLNVCRNPLTAADEAQIWRESSIHKGMTFGGILTPHSPPHYNTVTTADPLTPDQVIGLNN